jgi:alkaline phosphatase
MDPEATIPYTSLAEQAKTQGMKVGIISSVSIDHATPAVFYAHQPSRNNYEEIDLSLLASPFDYFAGGGFRVNKWGDTRGATDAERYAWLEQEANRNGFIFTNTRAEFDALQPIIEEPASTVRAIAINPYLDGSNAIPYALNRMQGDVPGGAYEGSITLAEFTAKGVELLDNANGFFMMIEGGKIDWAGHANDARAAIEDTLAFDDAVKVALDFAREHPQETLIVVTGDHECGGMTLGFAGTAYDTYFEVLSGQTLAYDDFDKKVFEPYKAGYQTAPMDIDAAMWQIIHEYFGLDGIGLTEATEDDLTEYEHSLLEAAFDKAMDNGSVNMAEQDNLLYGYYNPLSVTLTHLLNRRAGLTWTSYSHTAVPVPVMAQGPNAEIFNGYYDNTEVARKIATIMNVKLDDNSSRLRF